LNRNAIGYEIQVDYLPLIRQRLGMDSLLPPRVSIYQRGEALPPVEPPEGYAPRIKDATPLIEPKQVRVEPEATYRVVGVAHFAAGNPVLLTEEGLQVALLGVRVPAALQEQALGYLKTYVVGKRVLLRFECPHESAGQPVPVYLYLTNRLFVNRKMIEMGLAEADREREYRYRERFIEAERRRNGTQRLV
jgi:hypothetical protein